MRALILFSLAFAASLSASACKKNSPSKNGSASVEPAGGKGEKTVPRVQPEPGNPGAPVETGPPNVPEFKPALEQQTRAPAIETKARLSVEVIAEGLDRPWAFAFLPDGSMLVTEKHDGQLYVLGRDGKKQSEVAGVPKVDGGGQGGLLDVELDPDYSSNSHIYLTYYEPREGGNGLAVARARLMLGSAPRLGNLKVIFRMQPTLNSDKHAGGRLVFAPDGKLFVTLGERSVMEGRRQARMLDSHFGKIVRIHPDGSVPSDNPFVEQKGALPEIWSLGHRNILGADLDDKNRLWIAEMGPRGGDELNLVEKGKDYGWPTIGYGEEYSGKSIHKSTQAKGLEQPVYYWDPVISPGALAIYSGDLFAEWKGDFLIAGLSSQALIRLDIENDRVVGEERLLTDRNERLRDVLQGPDGAVYVLTDGGKAQLLKITPGD
jgi:glucose/arabinose dehydrogenase